MLIPPLYGNIQFVGIAENVFKRLLVFVLVFEDDFDCMVFVNQNAVNKGHQHTAVQFYDVFILLEKRYQFRSVVPVVTVCFISFLTRRSASCLSSMILV